MKVKDEIADDADADDYDEAREEGEVEDEGDDAGNDDDEITGQGKIHEWKICGLLLVTVTPLMHQAPQC